MRESVINPIAAVILRDDEDIAVTPRAHPELEIAGPEPHRSG